MGCPGGDINFLDLVGLIWTTRTLQERNGESLTLNSDFVTEVNIFMEPSDCDEISLCKILYFVRGMGLLA
jgi:hypothetical protein